MVPPLLTCENTTSAASVGLPNCTSEQSCDLANVDRIKESQSVIPVNNDHCNNAVPVTPREAALERKLTFVQRQLAVSRKKVKILMQSKRRSVARNANLKDVIAELRKQSLMGVDS
jgi:CBS-domain-containing membrane protein